MDIKSVHEIVMAMEEMNGETCCDNMGMWMDLMMSISSGGTFTRKKGRHNENMMETKSRVINTRSFPLD